MKTRFLRGDRTANNGLTLPSGELSFDGETKALRLHDGSTLGGFEMVGQRAYVPMGHGPDTLIGGDDQWGFYGEVASSDFITGDALATQLGLSAGTSQYSTTEWLKFNSNGQVVMVPKKPLRYSLSWEHIYQVGAVYGDPNSNGSNPSGTARLQDAVVAIDGFDYRVRLLKGAASDPTVQGADGEWTGYDIDLSHGSEWNRLFYPVHSGVHTNASNPTTHSDPNADPFGSWASYSDAELLVHRDHGNGSYAWCQETSGDNTGYRVYRGNGGVSYFIRNTATLTYTSIGWRPCLELVV